MSRLILPSGVAQLATLTPSRAGVPAAVVWTGDAELAWSLREQSLLLWGRARRGTVEAQGAPDCRALAASGDTLYVGHGESRVERWSLRTRLPVTVMPAERHAGGVDELVAGGDFVFSSGRDGRTLRWSRALDDARSIGPSVGRAHDLALSPDATRLALCASSGLTVLDTATLRPLAAWSAHEHLFTSVCWWHERGMLIVGTSSGRLLLGDIAGGALRSLDEPYPVHAGLHTAVRAVRRLGPYVISQAIDGTLKIWNPADWRAPRALPMPAPAARVACHPRLPILAIAGSDDATLQILGIDGARLEDLVEADGASRPLADKSESAPASIAASNPANGDIARADTAVDLVIDGDWHVDRNRLLELEAISYSPSEGCLKLAGRTGDIDKLRTALERGWDGEGASIREAWIGKTCLYERLPSVKFSKPIVANVGTEGIRAALEAVDVLIVTVTELERHAVMNHLKPLGERRAIVRGSVGLMTFRVGSYGRYGAAHVECSMGSSSPQASALTVIDAIDIVQPKAIFILGYAFGVRSESSRLGDVLVADAVAGYELGKVTAGGSTHRAIPLPSALLLRERFGAYADDWKFYREDGRTRVAINYGLVLSGEKVIADELFLANLRAYYPAAIGGEMEGTGAYAAAQRRSAPILLVKGICDWADGHKNDRAQPFAALASASLAFHVLDQPDVLDALKAVDVRRNPRAPVGCV